jgi:hypothetical protein
MATETYKESPTVLIAPKTYREHTTTEIEYDEPYAIPDKDEDDESIVYYDINNYTVENTLYKPRMNSIYDLSANSFENIGNTTHREPITLESLLQSKVPFKTLFDRYCAIKDSEPKFIPTTNGRLRMIESFNPLVKEAYDVLGQKEVIRLKYHTSNIQREIIKQKNRGDDREIASLVEEALPLKEAIPLAEAKEKLQAIYKELGLNRIASATDLSD